MLPLPLPLPWPSLPVGGESISVPDTTQNPSTQSRPALQSEVFVHAKSPLLCVIEQLEGLALERGLRWIRRT